MNNFTPKRYYIGREIPFASPEFNPKKLAGPNVWPTVKSCPQLEEHECDRWKQVMLKYQQEAASVSHKLVQLIALAIGLEDRSYFNESFTKPLETLRLLHYSREKSDPEKGVFGCGGKYNIISIKFIIIILDYNNSSSPHVFVILFHN